MGIAMKALFHLPFIAIPHFIVIDTGQKERRKLTLTLLNVAFSFCICRASHNQLYRISTALKTRNSSTLGVDKMNAIKHLVLAVALTGFGSAAFASGTSHSPAPAHHKAHHKAATHKAAPKAEQQAQAKKASHASKASTVQKAQAKKASHASKASAVQKAQAKKASHASKASAVQKAQAKKASHASKASAVQKAQAKKATHHASAASKAASK
jgi:hypothetical protein